MEGNFVHRWHYPGGIAYGFLLDNGNLLFRDQGSNPPGADHIRELDSDSRLVWEYHNPSLRRHKPAFPTATTCSCCNATGYPRN